MKITNKSFTRSIELLCIVAVTLFAGCSKPDESGGGNERTGEPYKFRVELSCDEGENLEIVFEFGNYNYKETNGFPRTGWIIEADEELEYLQSPASREFEVIRNFNKMMISGAVFEILPDDILKNKNIHAKMFIDNNLVISSSTKFRWMCVIEYDSKTKKYTISDTAGKTIEKDKL